MGAVLKIMPLGFIHLVARDKFPLALLPLLLIAFNAPAQDVILTTSGETIQAKVAEVGESVIKYYKFENQSGPLYSKSTSGITKITYQNGSVDEFNKRAIILNDSLANISRTRPEDLLRKGNKVFVEFPDEASKQGATYFISELEQWNYWKVVTDESEAHFVLEYNADTHVGGWGSQSAIVVFKTKEQKEFKRSGNYWASGSETTSSSQAMAQRVALKYLRKQFK